MRSSFASRSVVAIALLVGSGCGSGGGCGTLKPIPTGLTPFGIPSSQLIEGGGQARITASGMAKLSSVVENLLTSAVNSSLACFIGQDNIYGTPGSSLGDKLEGWLSLCDSKPAGCTQNACGATAVFSSPDGLDKTTFSMADGSNPVMLISTAFDIDATISLNYGIPADLGSGTCNIEIYTPHFKNQSDPSLGNVSISAPIQFGINPTNGNLTLTLQSLQIGSLDITLGANGCGSLIDGIVSAIGGTITTILNSSFSNVIENLAGTILAPQINSIVQGFLPNPLGLAGVVDTSTLLASFEPPTNAGLETYLVPGGYVSAKANGLTLGVLAGMNSDADPATRTAALASEPNLCVPARPVLALGDAPYNLPANAVRSDFTLNAADQFSGTPDPVDPMGNPRDVLIGLSRTYLDVVGFHTYNSGTLCLHVDGATLGMLNTGTIGAFIPSLSNIALDPKAPLELQLRPQEAPVFTIGAGTTTDPLIHIALTDMRIDFYAWIEERWARIMTVAVDLNLGINLTVTQNAEMQPVLQPTLSGLTAANVTVRVTNSDLLSEPPAQLAMLLPSVISLAGGALTSGLPTFALPSVAGFSLSDLTIGRVQTSQDDFIGIYGTLATPTTPTPLVDWSDPVHPHLAGEVHTLATVKNIVVPPIENQRQLLETPVPKTAAAPKVELALGAEGAGGQPLEFSWKIDGSIWHEWTPSSTPTLEGGALMFQGNHTITVRSRVAGQYLTEDSQPVTLNVAIDAQPPGINPSMDVTNTSQLDLNGWDLVTATPDLEYAYRDATGAFGPFTKQSTLSLAEIGTLTNNNTGPLIVEVRDQHGFVGTYTVPAVAYSASGSWGRPITTASSGCSCMMGGAQTTGTGSSAALAFLAIAFLLAYRSRRGLTSGIARLVRRGAGRTVVTFVVVSVAAIHLAGCGCDKKAGECSVDDDCAKMQCNAGQIPVCQSEMCACVPDIPIGQIGRFASMTYLDGTAYVAAYNQTYGDLMIGSVKTPGVVANWDFVDGVPDQTPSTPDGHVRGGISAPGDDVGQYTSIAYTPEGDPVVAYYDATHAALKYASFGAIRWRSHTVDVGMGTPATNGDDVGTWASLSMDKEGRPGIAYTAIVTEGTASGMPEGQLRWAQANVADPQSASDWTVTVVDKRAVGEPTNDDAGPPPDMAGVMDVLPDVIAIMTSVARRSDDTPGIAYYDRALGNLRYATLSGSTWTTTILAGQAANGTDTGDEGQYPSLIYDPMDTGHISYVDAEQNALTYINTKDLVPEVVDDGYRPMDEMTSDGLPSPVYHLVGDSSSIQLIGGNFVIAYQDATDEELMLATGTPGDGSMMGTWATQKIAGHDDPFAGSYGFWATAKAGGSGVYIGSYAINQQLAVPTYYYQLFFTDLGIIQ